MSLLLPGSISPVRPGKGPFRDPGPEWHDMLAKMHANSLRQAGNLSSVPASAQFKAAQSLPPLLPLRPGLQRRVPTHPPGTRPRNPNFPPFTPESAGPGRNPTPGPVPEPHHRLASPRYYNAAGQPNPEV